METARAFWVEAPGRGAIRTVPLPELGPGDVRVRTLYSGISRGTESLVFEGRVPVSEHARMRAPFQDGDFPGPVKYGYANVGVVEAGSGVPAGRSVFALFPHQDVYVIPGSAVRVIPEEVPPGRAVLAANMETALNGVWDAAPQPGDRVVVLGAGTVGCLVAWLVRQYPGVSCVLADVDPGRAALARALDVPFASAEAVDGEATIVVHTSGNPAGLTRALEIAAPDGVIVEMSWFGDRPVSLPLGGAFHSRRLTIKASQVGAIPPPMRHRWTYAGRMDLALRLLANPALDALVTGESGFDELPEVMARLSRSPGLTACHRIRY